MSLFDRLKEGLRRTREQLSGPLGVASVEAPDERALERIEEALLGADMGVESAEEVVEVLREEIGRGEVRNHAQLVRRLKEVLVSQMSASAEPEDFPPKPWVVLVVGVNGVGKTTTIGKLAYEYRSEGKKVMLAAADTFRAGAVEQLRIWAERTGCEFVAQQPGADPASVAYDALEAAKARGTDVLLVDTAGRLHSKDNLMQELQKVARVVQRNTPHAPNEVLLVVDGSTGQNAIAQARAFHKALGLSGIVVTKLDGTARGGAVLTITRTLGVPVVRVGVGEAVEDLQRFDAGAYVDAMVGDPEG